LRRLQRQRFGSRRGHDRLARARDSLRERAAATVLTPHAGELGRLLGIDSEEVAQNRLARARDAAARSGALVVLKGDDSIVAQPEGPVAISPGATPALATAGTGDVLSGLVGALLSKGLPAFEAAAAGVLAHARAGMVAAAGFGPDHVIATDVIEALPEALDGRVDGEGR
jgi:NAD(P)H-hydrate epimerase